MASIPGAATDFIARSGAIGRVCPRACFSRAMPAFAPRSAAPRSSPRISSSKGRPSTASSLVKIDYDGNIVEDTGYPVNKAGFIIHSAVHMARPEVNCVLHTHTQAGIAVSCLAEGLLPINQHSLTFYDRLAYHDYEG